MTAATVLAGLWAALVLTAAWRARPHRAARRPPPAEVVGAGDAGGRRPNLAVVATVAERSAEALGGSALVALGVHRPELALRLGRAVLAAVLLAPWSALAAGAGGVIGFWLPSVLARRRAAAGARRLDAAAPELAELMLVAVGAGAGPRRALEVAARWAPPVLSDPLSTVVAGLHRGQRLDEVLQRLAGLSPAMRELTAAIAGAAGAGSPLATTLAAAAADGRRARHQQAQAAARRLPVLLLFPLTSCILPAFGLLTVGPALAAGLQTLQP